jgi:hypothetical protein
MHPSRLRAFHLRLTPVVLGLGFGVLMGGLEAQELPWLRGGTARLDFAPNFWAWDSRYGMGPGGSTRVEPLGLDLTADPMGSEMLPHLRDLESSLGDAVADPAYRIRLGRGQAIVDQARLVFPFRLEVGVTDWLTVGAMVPLVRPRTEITFAFDADSLSADVGPSPQETNPATVSQFLSAFEAVLSDARSAHPDDPEVMAAQVFLESLSRAYSHGTFFPISGSGAGTQLQQRLEHFRSAFGSLGVGGLPEVVPMAQEYLDEEGFRGYLAGQAMQAAPLEDWTRIWSLGDVELSASLRLLHGGFARDSLGEVPRIRYQVGAGMLVRLGTGAQADYNRFFDQDPGDGQADVEGSVFGLVELGSRLGAWGTFRYGVQNEGEVIRRMAALSETLPHRGRLTALYRSPGDYRELDINPRFYLNPAMSFGVRYRHWSKGADSHRLQLQPVDPDLQPGLDYPSPEVLDDGTEQTLRELGFTATLSTVDARARGTAAIPVHIRTSYFRPVDGSGGRTPRGSRFEVGVTIYRTFWGRPSTSGTESDPGPPGG